MSSAHQIRNITLLIGIPAFLAFAVLVFFAMRNAKPPADAVAAPEGTYDDARRRVGAFLDTVAGGDWDSARLYLTAADRERLGEDGLEQALAAHPAALAGGASFAPSEELGGDPAGLAGVIRQLDGADTSCRFVLRWASGQWWIVDIELDGASILGGSSS